MMVVMAMMVMKNISVGHDGGDDGDDDDGEHQRGA